MANLQVKGMDDGLYAALAARAAADNRSISQEVVTILKDFLTRPGSSAREATEEFLSLCGTWTDDRSAAGLETITVTSLTILLPPSKHGRKQSRGYLQSWVGAYLSLFSLPCLPIPNASSCFLQGNSSCSLFMLLHSLMLARSSCAIATKSATPPPSKYSQMREPGPGRQ